MNLHLIRNELTVYKKFNNESKIYDPLECDGKTLLEILDKIYTKGYIILVMDKKDIPEFYNILSSEQSNYKYYSSSNLRDHSHLWMVTIVHK